MHTPTVEPEAVDARDTEWHAFLTSVDELLAGGEYGWAFPTLEGIRQTVERTGRVSAKQRRAVERIRAGLWERRGRRWWF